MKRKKPNGENHDMKLRVIRRGMSQATGKYNISGAVKIGAHAPRPITLPTLKFTDPQNEI